MLVKMQFRTIVFKCSLILIPLFKKQDKPDSDTTCHGVNFKLH